VVEIVAVQGRDGQPHVRLWDAAIGNTLGQNRAAEHATFRAHLLRCETTGWGSGKASGRWSRRNAAVREQTDGYYEVKKLTSFDRNLT